MKKTLFFSIFAAALALVSCVKSELDPISKDNPVFPESTVIEATSLTSCVAEKDGEGRRVFTLDLTDGTTPVHMVLIGNKYFLTANQYTEALDAVAKNGNFVQGKTTLGGKNIKQGYINVSLLEETETEAGCENSYAIAAVIFLEDGAPYKVNWTGKIAFGKDAVLAPTLFYTDTIAADCTLEDGSTPVPEVESHTLVLKDAAGEFAAQIKLIRATGTKTSQLEGEYTVKEYAHEDFSAGNGFDLGVMFGMPAGSFVIGTYFFVDGALVIVEPGAKITVTDMGNGIYSIDGSDFSFLTAPEGYVPGAGPVYDMTDTVAKDCTLEDGSTPVEDVESHTLVLTDADNAFVAQIKLIRALGTTDLSGSYTVKEYAHEDFAAGNGFDLGAMFGMPAGSMVIGTYYVGEEGIVIVEPGETIDVSKISDDTYKFEGSTGWAFSGKLKAADPTPNPDPQPGDEDVVTLTDFLSLTDYNGMGAKLVGLELATTGFTYTPADWVTTYAPTYTVDGNFLKIEFFSEDGTVAPGTYTPSVDANNVAAGEFKAGSDGWGGANGSAWYTVASGAATYAVINDGSVTVAKEGDVYTIEVKSTALNAKYVGKLSK